MVLRGRAGGHGLAAGGFVDLVVGFKSLDEENGHEDHQRGEEGGDADEYDAPLTSLVVGAIVEVRSAYRRWRPRMAR